MLIVAFIVSSSRYHILPIYFNENNIGKKIKIKIYKIDVPNSDNGLK